LKQMFRQVGLLECDKNGIAKKGLIVRHLVLPGNLAQTRECLRFVAEEISPEAHVALMSQYNPVHEAAGHPMLKRKLSREEYDSAVACAEEFGLENCWIQELESPDSCLPDFTKPDSFGFDDVSR
jgi:putative pyruvate formate lyase activating enzyme